MVLHTVFDLILPVIMRMVRKIKNSWTILKCWCVLWNFLLVGFCALNVKKLVALKFCNLALLNCGENEQL